MVKDISSTKNSPKFTSRLNRTHLFDEQSSDFIYAANHSESNPVFNISAKVQGLSADETGKIKVVIEEGTTVYSPAVNYEGAFNFAARKKGHTMSAYHFLLMLNSGLRRVV